MREVVYISSIRWDFSWHRQQEMMSKLAEAGFFVLFVQPVQKGNWREHGPEKVGKNIWLLTPSGMPYERCSFMVNRINSLLSTKAIFKAMKKIGFIKPIVWMDRIHGFDFEAFSQYTTIYDLVDEILAFGRFRNNKMLVGLENRVLRGADLLLSSSNTLLKRKVEQSGRKGENYFLPNGVDVSRFSAIQKNNQSKKITIGFVGQIDQRRLNYTIIHKLASIYPEWRFLFVGPGTDIDKKKLKGNYENIKIEDAVDGDQIPHVIAQFNVGIIPYNCNQMDMDYVFPRKACEYLASGIPVVSTRLPEIEILKPFVRTAETVEEFAAEICDAIRFNDSEANRCFAAKFDWNNLMGELIKKLISESKLS